MRTVDEYFDVLNNMKERIVNIMNDINASHYDDVMDDDDETKV